MFRATGPGALLAGGYFLKKTFCARRGVKNDQKTALFGPNFENFKKVPAVAGPFLRFFQKVVIFYQKYLIGSEGPKKL
jgi:hypothetical protein